MGFFVSLARCKLGARLAQGGVGGNKKKCAFFARLVCGCSRFGPYVENLLGTDGT
jgi:hypothetical protein